MDLLEHPAWSGIAALATIVGVVAYLYVERDTFFDASMLRPGHPSGAGGRPPVVQRLLDTDVLDLILPSLWGAIYTLVFFCAAFLDRFLGLSGWESTSALLGLVPIGLGGVLALGVAHTLWEGRVRDVLGMAASLLWLSTGAGVAVVLINWAMHRSPVFHAVVSEHASYLHLW